MRSELLQLCQMSKAKAPFNPFVPRSCEGSPTRDANLNSRTLQLDRLCATIVCENHKRKQFYVRLRWFFFFSSFLREGRPVWLDVTSRRLKIYCQGELAAKQCGVVWLLFWATSRRCHSLCYYSDDFWHSPPLFLEAFKRPASANQQDMCQTCQRNLVFPVVHRCTLRSSSSPSLCRHKSDVWLPCSIPASPPPPL